MKKHHTQTHNAHLLRFPCEWCGTRYLTEASLQRHAKSKHPDIAVKTPSYSVFTNSPRLNAEPVKRQVKPNHPPQDYRFRLVTGQQTSVGAPPKLIKHQDVRDRPKSPAVHPTPNTSVDPATIYHNYHQRMIDGTTTKLVLASRLLEYGRTKDENMTTAQRFAQLHRDLATTSDENSTNTTTSSDTSLNQAVKRKHSRTPVCSGNKRQKLHRSAAPTTYAVTSDTSTNTSGGYNPNHPELTASVDRMSSTPAHESKSDTSVHMDISSLISSLDPSSLGTSSMFNTPDSKPNTPYISVLVPRHHANIVKVPSNQTTIPFNITDLVQALGNNSHNVDPDPIDTVDHNNAPTTAKPLVDYTSHSDEDTTTPDRDLIVFQILDLIERYDSSKTNLMRDILNMMLPPVDK